MIVDSMTKLEVMKAIRTIFDAEVLPYYRKKMFPKLKALILTRSQREKKTITLGWEEYISSSNINFKILKRGNAYGDKPEFIAEFVWKKKKCVATLFQDGVINVYQSHCLDRYSERVNVKSVSHTNLLNKYIFKH